MLFRRKAFSKAHIYNFGAIVYRITDCICHILIVLIAIGHGTKIRVHEGEAEIGAKTVLGQECTISAFQHISIGRECVIADRVMLIDFDHGVVEVERPIRLQGIYKRDVRVGSNCWIGYGACILRGATVGDNAIIGTLTKTPGSLGVVAGPLVLAAAGSAGGRRTTAGSSRRRRGRRQVVTVATSSVRRCGPGPRSPAAPG